MYEHGSGSADTRLDGVESNRFLDLLVETLLARRDNTKYILSFPPETQARSNLTDNLSGKAWVWENTTVPPQALHLGPGHSQ